MTSKVGVCLCEGESKVSPDFVCQKEGGVLYLEGTICSVLLFFVLSVRQYSDGHVQHVCDHSGNRQSQSDGSSGTGQGT